MNTKISTRSISLPRKTLVKLLAWEIFENSMDTYLIRDMILDKEERSSKLQLFLNTIPLVEPKKKFNVVDIEGNILN